MKGEGWNKEALISAQNSNIERVGEERRRIGKCKRGESSECKMISRG